MRPTREIVLIVFAATVGATIVASIVGLLTLELVHPDTETADGLAAAWSAASVLFGIVAGYLLGRRNGH